MSSSMANSSSASTEISAPSALSEAAVQSAAPIAGVHIQALDGIRGLAIVLVLFFHYGRSARDFGFQNPLLSASEFGWVGVDLFFVLSGFLITGILYDARGSKKYFRNFYARRSLRIFPLYYLALVVVLVLAALWPGAGVWPTFSPLWFVFYLSNVAMITQAPLGAGILSHFWSLAIEEHFYLFWPVLVFFAARQRLMAIAAGLLVFSLSLRVMLAFSGAMSPEAFYFLTPLRLDGLVVGAICSLAVRGAEGVMPWSRAGWMAMLGGGAAVLLIVLFARTLSYHNIAMQTFGFTFLAVAFGGLLLVTLSFGPANRIFSHPVLRWFGRYSYGLYVWHPIVNVLLFYTSIKALFGVQGALASLLYLVFAFSMTLAVALASYHFMEKKFLSYKSRFH
jgi:peptidoglycan/LPS O-acetylase OafA/YrhL